jgi:ATP-dependent Clp protease ATP-binding subunit ClpC
VFDRFTDQTREVVHAAQDEARLMRHAHIGTEHMLVGLARGQGDAAALLHGVGLTGEAARAEVVRLVGMGDHAAGGELPFTPAAKDALELAVSEAMRLGHDRADSAHLLLAILRQPDAVARRILMSAGAAPRDVRNDLIERLSGRPRATPPSVDGQMLLEILARDGAVAAWLRERGVDEAAVRRMLGG